MSNRTDFSVLSRELAELFGWSEDGDDRLQSELHNAFVAGQENHGAEVSDVCLCKFCIRLKIRASAAAMAEAIRHVEIQAIVDPKPGDYWALIDEDCEDGPVGLFRANGNGPLLFMPRKAFEDLSRKFGKADGR